jgi:cytochrome c biogenesis protein CcmG, thiol:disulfide interchange protein DsbE
MIEKHNCTAMKKIAGLVFLILISIGCRPRDYFKINENNTLTEKEFSIYLENSNKALPKDYSQTPIIYNKLIKDDSVVNYVYFKKIWWGDKDVDPKSFEIVYKQDSTYLFLDRKLPYFNFTDLNGNTTASDQLLGKPTLINFWFTNCGGCIAEIPELNKLVEKYKEEVNFIAFSLDNTDSVKKFLTTIPFNFKHIPDASKYITKELMIKGFPLNYFLDKNGYIREILRAMPTESDRFSANTYPKLSNLEFDKILEKLTKL